TCALPISEGCRARAWIQWLQRVYRATQTMDAALPPEARCILVDNDAWTTVEIHIPRPCVPFTEREGQYWGPPDDDAHAVQEFERLRAAGARFLVVGWPA